MTIHGLNYSHRSSSQSLQIKPQPAPTIKVPTIPIVEDEIYQLKPLANIQDIQDKMSNTYFEYDNGHVKGFYKLKSVDIENNSWKFEETTLDSTSQMVKADEIEFQELFEFKSIDEPAEVISIMQHSLDIEPISSTVCISSTDIPSGTERIDVEMGELMINSEDQVLYETQGITDCSFLVISGKDKEGNFFSLGGHVTGSNIEDAFCKFRQDAKYELPPNYKFKDAIEEIQRENQLTDLSVSICLGADCGMVIGTSMLNALKGIYPELEPVNCNVIKAGDIDIKKFAYTLEDDEFFIDYDGNKTVLNEETYPTQAFVMVNRGKAQLGYKKYPR